MSGEHIEGAVRYNERKVEKGVADLILASDFPKDAEALSLQDKTGYLKALASGNTWVKRNCVHISLNFSPDDLLDQDKLREIAQTYMAKVGFGDQPFLVYQHYDAAHPHLHIVTTNINAAGERISLHNIGKLKSEPARKEIEQSFGLIPAEGRKTKDSGLKPLNPEILEYGKPELKAAMSNIIAEVVRSYKFSNLSEFNAVLGLFNMAVDRGREGTRLYETGGLIYTAIDKDGERVGVPIKASAFYRKPTLKNLEKRFTTNNTARQAYGQRLGVIIDRALRSEKCTSRAWFKKELQKAGISVVFQTKEHGRRDAAIFVDHRTKAVFSGSDLGPGYHAREIDNRIMTTAMRDSREFGWNRRFVKNVLSRLDYSRGFPDVLKQLLQQGVIVRTTEGPPGIIHYQMGYLQVKPECYFPIFDEKLTAYLRANGFNPVLAQAVEERLRSDALPVSSFDPNSSDPIGESVARLGAFTLKTAMTLAGYIGQLIEDLLSVERSYGGGVPYHFRPKKKKKKRRPD